MSAEQYLPYEEYGISKYISRILFNRGIKTSGQLRTYISPALSDLNDPFLFKDMKKAVEIINEAVKNNKKILIYGDYDADGVCAVSILAQYLKKIGANVLRFIPDRKKDGYGLNMQKVKMIIDQQIDLVITVDNGIAAIEEALCLRENNISLIVTDHHEPCESLPVCDAILDAKVNDETYPYRELCGAGVALKLIQALSGQNELDDYLCYAALATVADSVPLTFENRTIVKLGLEIMNNNPPIWVRSIQNLAKIETITSYHLGYIIGPMINACGRIETAKSAIEFLMETDEIKSYKLAEKIKVVNDNRKEIEKAIIKDLKCDCSHNILIGKGNWDHGVVGLAASRITETYNKPSLVFTFDANKDLYTGSGRSITGINLFERIGKYKDLLYRFGGHEMAIGLSVSASNFKAFTEKIYLEFDSIEAAVFEKKTYYDFDLTADEISTWTDSDSAILEPTGYGAPSLNVRMSNISFTNLRLMDGHTDCFFAVVNKKNKEFRSLAFHQSIPNSSSKYDIIVSLSNGLLPLKIVSLMPSDSSETSMPDSSVIIASEINTSDSIENFDNSAVNEKNYGIRSVPISLSALGISDKKIAQFNKAGIYNSEDLVNYFPKKYMDFRKTINPSEIKMNGLCAIIGVIKNFRSSNSSKGTSYVTCTCEGLNGDKFSARWFNQSYVTRMLEPNRTYIFCGTGYVGDMGYPSINVLFFSSNISKLQTLIPIYKKIPGMSNDYLIDSITKAIEKIPYTDYLEKDIVDEFNLLNQSDSTRKLHSPHDDSDISSARRRKVFDELFNFNFILKNKLTNSNTTNWVKVNDVSPIKKFEELLPYSLTVDQKQTIAGIIDNIKTSEVPINALVQGDVGCGKTIVAFIIAAVMARNNYQSCIVAPTEILAFQHYQSLKAFSDSLGIKIGYLSGSTKAKEKKAILNGLINNEIDILIGTHAVFSKNVVFNNLGLVIIDEQHKFGVEQRDSFSSQLKQPHIITMSATPIPRTLAMAIFGDCVSVYNIKSKPAGRKTVKTIKMDSSDKTNTFILDEIRKGHQAYIVCPLIDESEKLIGINSIKSTVEEVKAFFSKYPEIEIADISGRMKSEEVAEKIERFKNNQSQILISTTIIEVGVNVPNATVIAIKSSERFGLAQAHQLRGRVGRGDFQSYCLLQPSDPNDLKADILCNNSDGFDIAKEDLKLRGTGDFIGTSQSGSNKTVMLMLAEPDLYKRIADLNSKIFSDPVRFSLYEYILDNSSPT